MASSEKTGKIVVDATGRITELPDDCNVNLVPLKIGDHIVIDWERLRERVTALVGSIAPIQSDIADDVVTDTLFEFLRSETIPSHDGWAYLSAKYKALELLNNEGCESSSIPSTTSSKLMEHAIETFGSEKAAKEWLSIECGALNNESPANFIHKTGNVAEVDRILGCIDYGMIA